MHQFHKGLPPAEWVYLLMKKHGFKVMNKIPRYLSNNYSVIYSVLTWEQACPLGTLMSQQVLESVPNIKECILCFTPLAKWASMSMATSVTAAYWICSNTKACNFCFTLMAKKWKHKGKWCFVLEEFTKMV